MSSENTHTGGVMSTEDNRICNLHQSNVKDITEIKDLVNKHAGQWKLLLVGLGIFTSSIVGFASLHYAQQKELVDRLTQMNVIFSNYISKHQVESATGFSLIEENKATLKDHEKRIRNLERGTP